MADIITAKLEQHPRLVSEITKEGGSNWIMSSTHQPTKHNNEWETGGKNWFIKALNDAYLNVKKQPATLSEEAPKGLENVQGINFPKMTDDFTIDFTDAEGKQHKIFLKNDALGVPYFMLATKREDGSYKPERNSKGKVRNRKENDAFIRDNLPKDWR